MKAEFVPQPFQLYGALSAATEAALRASIKLHGVITEVVVDQNDRIVDGHHRSRIANELGVGYRKKVVTVKSDDHAKELARSLNEDRRQLSADERRPVVGDLRAEGHSVRAIADALGVPKSTIQDDLTELSGSGQLAEPERVKGLDGKERPATRKPAKQNKSESGKPPKKSKKAAAVDPEAEKYAPNLVDELERAGKTIEQQGELIEALQNDDHAKELAKWKLKYDQLSGRLQQCMATMAEAKKDAQRHFDLITKIRKALKLDKPTEILPAIEALRKAK